MPIRPSSPAFSITSTGKRFSRSISSAIGRTSPSAKSRANRWMSRCSSLSSNIGGGAYPGRLRGRPALLGLRELLGARQPVQELVVERGPVILGGARLGGLRQLRWRHLARHGRVARPLLLQLGARLVELALAGGEQVTKVLLHARVRAFVVRRHL